MGLRPPELTQGMQAAVSLTVIGLAEPLPIEEAVQCGAVLAIAVAKFCDPIKCQFDELYTETFPVHLPPSLPHATKANSRNLLKGNVPQAVIDALDTAVEQQAWLNAHATAMLHTVFRRYSAKVQKDARAEKYQALYQNKLCKDITAKTRESTAAWKALLAAIRKARVKVGSVTPARVVRFQRQILERGFPSLETTLLGEYHLTDRDIHWLRIACALVPPPRAALDFKALIARLIALNEQYQFCECRCDQ